MLEVLLWLDRFDLDDNQITTRRLCSLVENKQMPLRKVERVEYCGDERRYWDPLAKNSTLSIVLEEHEKDSVALDTDKDARTAASFLSSCFVRYFDVYAHRSAFPKHAIIGARALIDELDFRYCDFDNGAEDTLSDTLSGSTFRNLSFVYSSVPAWQIDDKLLKSLRLRGCNELHIEDSDDVEPYDETTRYNASKNSHLMCNVELRLEHLRFDVSNLDVGVSPSRCQEYDADGVAHMDHVRYIIADHGNGVRLLIHFKSKGAEEWEVIVRHAKKDQDEFFGPKPTG
ncbi:hypothetical protein AAVH_25139 [Aphelenchoides avenae]|nr:hypothetical protein AAVH_25139 [Aphelenchus avenae]